MKIKTKPNYKKLYLVLMVIFSLQSCYSPKTDVEEDKHPEIPQFPKFSDKKTAVKIFDVPLDHKVYCEFLQNGDYFFVYREPDYREEYSRFFIFYQGKSVLKEKWKQNIYLNFLAFMDDDGNIYADNRKYFAPDYSKKGFLPFYNLADVHKKYQHLLHPGEPEKDSALQTKITTEKQQLQKQVFDKVNTILAIDSKEVRTEELPDFSDTDTNYLCNIDEKPFFVFANIFATLNDENNDGAKQSVSDEQELYVKFRPKMKILPVENIFSRNIHKKFLDTGYMTKTDSIVSGNQWFNYGNHFVGSFGYTPLYMRYYKMTTDNVVTKDSQSGLAVTQILKTPSGRYFLTENTETGRFQVYYLKN